MEQSIQFASQRVKVLGWDKVTLDLVASAKHGSLEFNSTATVDKALDFLDRHPKAKSAP